MLRAHSKALHIYALVDIYNKSSRFQTSNTMKRYKESCGAEITVLLASFGVHRAGAGLRRVLEGQNLRRGQKEKKGRKKRRRLQRTRSGPIDGKDFLKGNANVYMQVLEDRVRACVAFFFSFF